MNVFIATIENDKAFLSGEESWHCARVLRNKVGDNIKLIDGKGNFFEGKLEAISDKHCVAKITSDPVSQKRRNYYLHLAIAPTKQIDRIEWMLEKAVEIGLDEISFINCNNSERTQVKKERLIKVVESAVKQSLQAYLPIVNSIIPFEKLLQIKNVDQKLIAHCHLENKSPIQHFDFKNKSTLALVGPEGDFTKQEIELARTNNFEPISLGENRLRTETAGLYISQAISLLS